MTNYFADIDMRPLAKNRERVERFNNGHGGFRNALFASIKDRALDGAVIKFNTPFPNPQTRRLVMFEPDSFGDLSRQTVGFWIDHQPSSEVATTDNGLSLIVDDDAIQFRLLLEQATNGYVIARMCETGNREAVSVHCDILESRTETVAGKDVQVVSRARLKEISICRNGAAGDNAFAMLVDTTLTPKPVAGSRSAKFQKYNALYKVSRKVRELQATNTAVIALQERIALIDEPAPFSWSMADCNRHQAEWYDQMQSERRAAILGV